jgi:hypothetical protein
MSVSRLSWKILRVSEIYASAWCEVGGELPSELQMISLSQKRCQTERDELHDKTLPLCDSHLPVRLLDFSLSHSKWQRCNKSVLQDQSYTMSFTPTVIYLSFRRWYSSSVSSSHVCLLFLGHQREKKSPWNSERLSQSIKWFPASTVELETCLTRLFFDIFPTKSCLPQSQDSFSWWCSVTRCKSLFSLLICSSWDVSQSWRKNPWKGLLKTKEMMIISSLYFFFFSLFMTRMMWYLVYVFAFRQNRDEEVEGRRRLTALNPWRNGMKVFCERRDEHHVLRGLLTLFHSKDHLRTRTASPSLEETRSSRLSVSL